MAGHSHSANIARRKAAVDAQRGKAFSKLARLIMVAAKEGGGDAEANVRLRGIVDKARAAGMPKDNIERAIKKGTGELAGEALEEQTYEGYAPGGVAVMLEVLTDNRNRTASDLRQLFSRSGGNLGENGCVAYLFQKASVVVVPSAQADEDTLLEIGLEAGADNVTAEGDLFVLTAPPEALEALEAALSERSVQPDSAEVTLIPSSTVPVDGDTARKVSDLLTALEEHDDVQAVYSNEETPEGAPAA